MAFRLMSLMERRKLSSSLQQMVWARQLLLEVSAGVFQIVLLLAVYQEVTWGVQIQAAA